MIKFGYTLFVIFTCFCLGYSQVDEIWIDSETDNFSDTTISRNYYSTEQVEKYVYSKAHVSGQFLIGGYISSIFHESVDSAKIIFRVDNKIIDSVYADNGLFNFILTEKGSLIDLTLIHPDFHQKDTSFLFPESEITILYLNMQPKYKILLRGRVFAGNMPLEGVNVEIKHSNKSYKLTTLGCYYDKEDYWNCLFDGMFKLNLTTENPNDSVYILLSKSGMKSYKIGMTINEYTGDILYMRMKYEPNLPVIPYNNLNFKISFPLLSLDNDWFVSLSYYRLINSSYLRRLAYGVEANMYVTTLSVTNNTFRGLDPSTVDSSYINVFAGPSVLFWFIPPEKRMLSSYAGCTFAYNFSNPALVFQPFIGTRFFLDMNKAVNIEIRYCKYNADVVHYTFNPYGSAFRYNVESTFDKLNANIGIQIVF